MSTQTTHLKLDLREASDIFNPLSTNANFESLDNIIYDIQKKGGVPTFTTTASANLLKLSENPTPNSTVFKFVAAGDANTWSFAETINDIVALDGSKKTVKSGEMYVAWVNSANAMVVIAWPDVVNAQTFDGKGPNEWASAAQLQAVNTTAANATQTAQAAATVANQALTAAQGASKISIVGLWTNPNPDQLLQNNSDITIDAIPDNCKLLIAECVYYPGATTKTYQTGTLFYTKKFPAQVSCEGSNSTGSEGYIRAFTVKNSTTINTGRAHSIGTNELGDNITLMAVYAICW